MKDVCVFKYLVYILIIKYHRIMLIITIKLYSSLSCLEKTELFLELFGNGLVRPQASEYLQQKSNEFIR